MKEQIIDTILIEDISYTMQFGDGMAVEVEAAHPITLHYPTIKELTEEQQDEVRRYCGLKHHEPINQYHIALKYGKVTNTNHLNK